MPEPLRDSTRAIFTLESGLKIDSGETDVANTLFIRQAYVGLKTGHGTLTFGRQYTPLFWAVTQVADPFRTGCVGNAKSLLPTAGIGARTSNTVYYLSPEVHGFSVDLAYALGEQAGDAAAGRQIGGSLRYAGSKLNARLVVNPVTAMWPPLPPRPPRQQSTATSATSCWLPTMTSAVSRGM